MWRDAQIAKELFDSNQKPDKKLADQLAQLQARKNERGEIVFDYDEFDKEEEEQP